VARNNRSHGNRNREPLLTDAQQSGIAEVPAVLSRGHRVCTLNALQSPQVAQGEHIGEFESIWAGNLHLAFGPDIPESDIVYQRPVFLHRIAVTPRMVLVIDDAVGFHTVSTGSMKIGRLSNPGVHEHFGLPCHGYLPSSRTEWHQRPTL